MKKTLFILFFFPMIFFGQNKSFELGLLFGGTINSLNHVEENYGNVYKKSLRPLGLGGFTSQYNFTKRFSLKSKLLYHIKGARLKLNSIEGITFHDAYRDFHYVTLPVLAQLNFSIKRWGFFCNTGFYLARLIKVEEIYKKIEGIEVDFVETSPSENFNKMDLGFELGYGLSFQINERIRMFLESSLDYGLLNTYKKELPKTLTETMTGTIGITYSFIKKRKVFNGISKLECVDHEEKISLDEKKKSKWRLVLYKDGKKVGAKPKKGKSRLFKKKD